MESWSPRRRARRGPLPAPGLLGLILLPWTLPLAGAEERSVTHTGLPILVSLANKAVSFHCSITYPYTPEFKNFTVRYFHVDLQGRTSSEEKISCQPGTGSENQTHTTVCPITLKPPNASATGTYYCSVLWPDSKMMGEGTFILVRDTGYQEPPRGPRKLLLSCFVGILAVLSILATALLLWKKPGPLSPCSTRLPRTRPCVEGRVPRWNRYRFRYPRAGTDAGSVEACCQEVPGPHCHQQPKAASIGIRLHGSTAPRVRGLRLHPE
ncbi:NFAT activation molecule 1 isoform 1-T1 [Dama dama]|uniref:NFAT activation molecule 1 isoform X1 n=1 Tax=Dama dama TaxID=30532 RepID=UPI002A35B576|nr:NFAT activation molecule 1 isoform X1 [Dama dama]